MKLFIVFTLIFFISCEKQAEEDVFKIYSISKGNHESDGNNFEYSLIKSLKFYVIFDSSAIYKTSDTSNQNDINKLYGFTDCGSMIHDNSARFGWRWYNNQLQLLSYCYVNGNIKKKFITNVDIGEEIYCAILSCNEYYLFQVNELPFDTVKRACSFDSINKYMCYPYFGGNETAPHKIAIKIKNI